MSRKKSRKKSRSNTLSRFDNAAGLDNNTRVGLQMTDKYIDLLAEREAEKAKKSGNQKLYDNHEQRSLANLNATRAEAGKPPLTLEQVKAMKKKQNSGLLGAFDENPLGF